MNQFWHRSGFLLLGVMQLVAASNFSWAADRAAEKLLPKETLLFVSVTNVPEMAKKWDRTSMGQMFHDPQMKSFVENLGKVKDGLSKDYVEKSVGVSIDDLLELPQGELAIALTELPGRKHALVIMMDYGSNQATIDKLLKKLDESLENGGKQESSEEIEGVKVQIYADKDAKSKAPMKSVAYFTDKSYFAISNEVDALKEVLIRRNGNSDDSLAQNDQYEYIQNQCKTENSDPSVKVFLNPIGLIQVGISLLQASVPEAGMAAGFLPLVGLDALKGWGGTLTFDEGDFESITNFFVYAENPRGVLGLFSFPATPLSPPKWVPETAGSFAMMNWDVQGAYSSIESLVDQFLGPGATSRQLEELADQGPMIHLKKDLLDHLDGKINFLQNESKATGDDESPAPLILLGVGVKDVAKAKKTLAAVAKSDDSTLESRDFNGETIYEFGSPDGEQTFSLAITEGNLVLTNDTPMLEAMMRGKSGRATALVDSDLYKKFAKLIPTKISMLGFQRNDVQMKILYELVKNADADFIDGLDLSKLPPFEAISKYLLPSASYVVPDKKGAKTVSFTLKQAD